MNYRTLLVGKFGQSGSGTSCLMKSWNFRVFIDAIWTRSLPFAKIWPVMQIFMVPYILLTRGSCQVFYLHLHFTVESPLGNLVIKRPSLYLRPNFPAQNFKKKKKSLNTYEVAFLRGSHSLIPDNCHFPWKVGVPEILHRIHFTHICLSLLSHWIKTKRMFPLGKKKKLPQGRSEQQQHNPPS